MVDQCLQYLLNVAACPICVARHHNQISPVLETLPWLSIQNSIMFKLVDLCVQSASTRVHTHTWTTTDQWSFADHGMMMWNQLSASLCWSDLTLLTFKSKLQNVQTTAAPISCHFRDCKVLLSMCSLFVAEQLYVKYWTFTFFLSIYCFSKCKSST